jgi:hypothetical protein
VEDLLNSSTDEPLSVIIVFTSSYPSLDFKAVSVTYGGFACVCGTLPLNTFKPTSFRSASYSLADRRRIVERDRRLVSRSSPVGVRRDAPRRHLAYGFPPGGYLRLR